MTESNERKDEAQVERNRHQINRLTRIIDVLYALMLFQLFLILPRPELDHFSGAEIKKAFLESSGNYLVLLVGLLMIIIYWGQSNLQYGNLKRSDATHAGIAIIQLFSLMVYLYFVRFDVQFDGPVFALRMESIFLALSGFLAILSWRYALRKGLVSDTVHDFERRDIMVKLLPEPIVAVFTTFFAGFGPDIWTLSWLALIPVNILVKRVYKSREAKPA